MNPAQPTTTAIPPLVLLAVWLAGFLWLLGGILRPVNFYDEGIAAVCAWRLLGGEVPYRDFWTLYAPGGMVINAAGFVVFGESLLGLRLMDTFVRATLATLVFVLAWRGGARWAAAASWVAAVGFLGYLTFYGYGMIPALVLVLLAIAVLALGPAGTGGSFVPFLAGLVGGLAGLVRQDAGLFLATTGIAFLALESAALGWRVATRRVAAFCGGGVLVVGPALLVTVLVVGPAPLWETFVRFPLEVYAPYRALPYPSLAVDAGLVLRGEVSAIDYVALVASRWLFALPAVALFAGTVGCVALARRGELLASDAGRLLALLTLGCLAALKHALLRPDHGHLIPHVVMGLTLLAVARAQARNPLWRAAMFAALLGAVAGLGVVPAYIRAMDWRHRAQVGPPAGAPEIRSRLGGVACAPDHLAALSYARTLAGDGGAIYLGTGRHDKALVNDVMGYFLLGRPVPTRFHELHPGLTTEAPAQEVLLRELDGAGVRVVVLWSGADAVAEPNRSGVPSRVGTVDDWLGGEFRSVRRFGAFDVRVAVGS